MMTRALCQLSILDIAVSSIVSAPIILIRTVDTSVKEITKSIIGTRIILGDLTIDIKNIETAYAKYELLENVRSRAIEKNNEKSAYFAFR